jgi:hypothetical protein
MDNKQEKLILETLFLILESSYPKVVNCDHDRFFDSLEEIKNQKCKINDRLVEIQRKET